MKAYYTTEILKDSVQHSNGARTLYCVKKISAVTDNSEEIEWMGCLTFYTEVSPAVHRFYITDLIIHPDHRRKRIGTSVLVNSISAMIEELNQARRPNTNAAIRILACKSPIIDKIIFENCHCEYVLEDSLSFKDEPEAYWEMSLQ